MWLSGWSAGLWTKGSLVRFPVRAHAWVVGRVPSRGHSRGNHTDVSLPLSPTLPCSLKYIYIYVYVYIHTHTYIYHIHYYATKVNVLITVLIKLVYSVILFYVFKILWPKSWEFAGAGAAHTTALCIRQGSEQIEAKGGRSPGFFWGAAALPRLREVRAVKVGTSWGMLMGTKICPAFTCPAGPGRGSLFSLPSCAPLDSISARLSNWCCVGRLCSVWVSLLGASVALASSIVGLPGQQGLCLPPPPNSWEMKFQLYPGGCVDFPLAERGGVGVGGQVGKEPGTASARVSGSLPWGETLAHSFNQLWSQSTWTEHLLSARLCPVYWGYKEHGRYPQISS